MNARTLTEAEWSLAQAAPGQCAGPEDVARTSLSWIPASVPGTVAGALQAAGQWDLDRPLDVDGSDWWYRCAFDHTAHEGCRDLLRFDGLATLADVWLNGTSILSADNMFQTHVVDVSGIVGERNELVIGFRSLGRALAHRRPRPRWKTKLVSHQQLRWFRTTLLGRIPGWSPPIAPAGPWRPISLECLRSGSVTDVDVRATLQGTTGLVEFSCLLSQATDARVEGAVSVGGRSGPISAVREPDGYRLSARVNVESAQRWWPHTHGNPHLYPCTADITIDGRVVHVDVGSVGFRSLAARTEDGGFALEVNGVPIFCRGACWTVNDILSLAGSADDLARDLTLMRQAGANMVRVGGTMLYESDAFYRLCDELGLLVWQDFMFANMDYPIEDAAFRSSVLVEASQQLRRLRRHPSLAVYCGNSEVEQQAAMLGMERGVWRNDLFARILPDLCAEWHPDVPYVPSTPSGGDLPFHSTGVTHYYGVGAYLRPVEEVRRARVRFTPECLGFANVPDADCVSLVMKGERVAPHDPRWKTRVPRDSGVGWDFEDVRDHYVRQLFSVDPVGVRSADPARYLELGRVTTGEVMSRVFSEWRSAHSSCHGGLVWFLKDLWPGAGWGILDSRGRPKSCFHYLRRVWQPRTVVITDEALDGLHCHVINEMDAVMTATLEIALLRGGLTIVAEASTAVEVAGRSTRTWSMDALLGRFYDVSYVYRFGPPTHDVVAATLYGPAHDVIAEAFWIRDASAVASQPGGAVVAEARGLDDDSYALSLTSERFLFAAHIDAAGFVAEDDYFCLMPGRTREIRLIAWGPPPNRLDGSIDALNLEHAVPISASATKRLVAS